MCGIAGYVSNRELDGNRMLQALVHRGPDANGEHREILNGRQVWLGHRRLSIIDLSQAGCQPMKSTDGRIVLIFNGEIYNYRTLRERYLQERIFISQTDSEVLLGLYEKYGIDCLRYLNGDFALCILDKKKQKLFLARDRVGVKPLYYYDHDNVFAFASEIKAFKAVGLALELEQGQLQNYFVFKYVPEDNTLFRHVKRLTPGCFLENDLGAGNFQIHRYWTLKKNPVYDTLKMEDAQEVFYDLLKDASRIRLMSDVPVGTFFSGGMDSSAIAYFIKDVPAITHYTARKSKEDLGREGSSSDFYFANKLAAEWNLNLVPIDIGQADTNSGLIRQVLNYSDDLIADGSQIPSFLITKEAGKTSRVMLSGMGSDELFLGYAGHQISLLASFLDKWPAFLARSGSKLAASLSQGRGMLKPYRRYLHKFGKYYNYPISERYGAYNLVGDLENAFSICQNDSKPSLDIFKHFFGNDDDLFDQINRFEIDNFLVKNLHYLDRMCMANSVEGRVPFLDHRLVEFAFSLPRDLKLSGLGQTKVVLKETMKPYFPDYLIKRRKAGFGMPLRSIFCQREKIGELLHKDFFENFASISLENIDKVIESHISGREDNSALIYALISFQEWHKLFIQGEAVQ
jgi:asparagine synthase (glutamine-hydrolysing)